MEKEQEADEVISDNENDVDEEKSEEEIKAPLNEKPQVGDHRSKSRRHSFSYLKLPRKASVRGRRASFSNAHVKDDPNIPSMPSYKPTLLKSAATSLAEGMLQLVRMYPNFVREISDFVFHQQIGQGGFGEVWLANDLRTGKTVAIKELYSDQMIGRTLQNFIREIITMAKTNNRFILPFVGYTIDKPYCIITEYMPNGSFYPLLRKEKKSPVFSGTHLTMIAIGLCCALRHLHTLHIIHRDLKTANILLDHNYLPKLCDFGIARFNVKNRPMTDGIGTASHMAPELLSSKFYSTKVDIFAYGMTLYEMVEKKNTFAGKSLCEIVKAIRNKVRPGFSRKDTPPGLIALIKQCWSHDASKRPSAKSIYNKFATGKAFFPGTDMTIIQKFVKRLDNELDEKKAKGSGKRSKKPFVDIASVLARLEKDLEYTEMQDAMRIYAHLPLGEDLEQNNTPLIRSEEEHEKYRKRKVKEDIEKVSELHMSTPSVQSVGTNILDIISNQNDPKFHKTVSDLMATISPQIFSPVYNRLSKILFETKDESLSSFIIQSFSNVIERSRAFVDIFERAHFFSNLPTSSPGLCNATLYFIGMIFVRSPNSIQRTIFRPLGALLNSMPAETLSLFHKYIDRYTRLKTPFVILDFLIKYARVFINIDAGVEFVDIIYNLMNIPDYVESRREKLIQIISAFCRSHVTNVAIQAVKAFTILRISSIDQIPFDALIKIIATPQGVGAAVSLLLRAEKYPVSKTLFRAICDKCSQHPKISRVLLKFAAQQKETLKIAVSSTKWMNSPTEASFKLMLLLFTEEEAKPKLIHSRHFPSFLAKSIKSCPQESISSMGTILRRIGIAQLFINRLEDAQFFVNLLEYMQQIEGDTTMLHYVFLILDTCIRAGYSNDYKRYLDPLASFLKSSGPLTKQAALLFVTLSSHKRMSAYFKRNASLVAYFTRLQNSQSMASPASVFLSNINSV